MIKKILVVAGLLLSLQAWGNRPIEIVVPFPPGGATDKLARVVGEMLEDRGINNTISNRPGADTVIGANYVAKSKPDGKTLFLGTSGSMEAKFVFKAPGMEYDEKSFVPIVPLARMSFVLAVPSASVIKNYEQFKFYVQANPEKFNLAFYNANLANIFVDWARREGLPRPNIVIYKGSAPQVQDLIGGHVPFAFDTWTALAPFYEDNRVRVIASLDEQSLAAVKRMKPDAEPIAISARHPQLDIGILYGLYAPAGTPQSVIDDINQIVNAALKQPKYKEKLEKLQFKVYGGTPRSLQILQDNNQKILQRVANNIESTR
jgi:tripartite-type tricarboxylate transporter receptor subunit TctC